MGTCACLEFPNSGAPIAAAVALGSLHEEFTCQARKALGMAAWPSSHLVLLVSGSGPESFPSGPRLSVEPVSLWL